MNKRSFVRCFIALFLCAGMSFFTFTSVQALLGDLDITGLVDLADMAIIDLAYNARGDVDPIPANWDWRADINQDREVDVEDLVIAGRNFGQAFDFHWPRRVANGRNDQPNLSSPVELDAVADSLGRVHVIWVESTTSEEPLYYSVLDPAGNPLTEDVLIANDAVDARLAVDSQNGAHIVWHPRFSVGGLYYLRINQEGRTAAGPVHVCDNCTAPAISVDRYDHAHLFYRGTSARAIYAVLDEDGLPLMSGALINSQYPLSVASSVDSLAIAIGPDGSRHLIWHESTGVDGGDLVYTRINLDGSLAVNQAVFTHYQGSYNVRRFAIQIDSLNAAHVLFYDNRETPGSVYWKSIDVNGAFSAEKLVTERAYASAGLKVLFDIDSSDRLHGIAYYKGGDGEIGYTRLDRGGNVLIPYQRVVYEGGVDYAITVDSAGNGMLLSMAERSDDYGAKPLFLVSTPVDASANDTTRADLVLDAAHLSVTNRLLKITDSAEITFTVRNGGWTTASGNQLTFSYSGLAGATQQFSLDIPDLTPFASHTLTQVIDVPDLEDMDVWPVTVMVHSASAETSTQNNVLVVNFGVTPPPKAFNLEVRPYDQTYTPDNPSLATPFPGAVFTAVNTALGVHQTISPSEAFSVFYSLPLDVSPENAPLYPTTYQLTLSAPGYSTASISVTAQRQSVANPYAITVDPANPLALYIDTWGSISGTVYGDGDTLAEASIWLDSGQTTVSDEKGQFTFEKIPAGERVARIWRRGFEPIPAQAVSVVQGETLPLEVSMQPTKRADVAGIVTDEYGNPLVNASVRLLADPGLDLVTATGDDGRYSLSADPFDGYTNPRIEATHQYYLDYSASLSGLEVGWPLTHDIAMTYVASGDVISQSGEVTSWNQNQTWCKSTGDDVPWNVKVLQFIGSEWCPDYEVDVNWGKHDYRVALEYTLEGSVRTLRSLSITFDNSPFMDYTVGGGMFSGGGETNAVTAERVDWVELVVLDSAGNPVGEPIWHDSGVWYSTETTDPAHALRRVDPLATEVTDWSNVAIRIFYTVGRYAALEEHSFENWNPPADVNMSGVGGASGANRQSITWRLSANTTEHNYALADYRSGAGMLVAAPQVAVAGTAAPAASSRVVSLGIISDEPVRVGAPLVVELSISGMDARPVYGLEFDLRYNEDNLRLVRISGAADLAGPGGSFSRTVDYAAFQAAGEISKAALVRLGAASGLAQGQLVRLEFVPLRTVTSTTLDLHNVYLVDIEGDTYTADSLHDISFAIERARVFIPLVRR